MSAEALAVLIAALDGHNPNIERLEGGGVRLRPGDRAPSDLDLTIEELLEQKLPTVALAEVANCLWLAVEATAGMLRAPMGAVNHAEVADRLRETLRAVRDQEAADEP